MSNQMSNQINKQENQQNFLVCYHCSSQILPGDLIEAELGSETRAFCCPGCMAIAQTIHDEGLEVFYARRVQSSERPAAYLALNEIPEKLKPYDDLSLRSRFTRAVGDRGDLERPYA